MNIAKNNLDIFGDFETLLGYPRYGSVNRLASPQLDMHEDQSGYVIKADLPGIKKEEIEITLTDNVLSLKGERKEETEKTGEGWSHTERWTGAFERLIEFPVEVDASKVAASFKDGVLEVKVPRAESAKPKQLKIEVK